LVASVVIFYNGVKMLRPALDDLMDRAPDEIMVRRIGEAALAVEEVIAIEKVKIRKIGLTYVVDLHVQADAGLSLHDAHIVSGKVKGAIREAVPAVDGVLIHMEPYEPGVPLTRPAALVPRRSGTSDPNSPIQWH
jgi:divalent metal cation (Fe/Co/Zn/Cd) transporter